jgi:hypothetical protein
MFPRKKSGFLYILYAAGVQMFFPKTIGAGFSNRSVIEIISSKGPVKNFLHFLPKTP